VANTTPVYVVVNAQPTWNATQGPSIIDQQLAAMARIEAECAKRDDAWGKGVRERLEKARVFYAELRERMRR
jgi:hypothetical protein